MINVSKLKGKIIENGFTCTEFAKELGMSKATFYRRLKKGQDKLSVGEVQHMSRALKLSKEEAIDIFLPNLSQF